MIPEPGVVPSALAEPTVRVRGGWTAAVVLANVGVFAAWLGPIQVLLAKQSEAVAPGNKEYVFGLVTGVGAAVSVVANPAFGAMSDRTTSRYGRRVPWVVAGAVGGAIGLGILSGAHVIALMLIGWCLMQLFGNALLAAATAVVPDRVPVTQRGAVGGWVAISQVLGALVGTALAAAFNSFTLGYVACAVFLLLSVVPYLLRSGDATLTERPAFVFGEFVKSFWISPRRYPDFGWAWLTRFLFNVGNALGTLYLFYYLQDEVGVADPDTGVLILTAIYSVCVLVTAISFGRWSDRSARRKVFVTASGWVMAAAGVVLAVWPTWPGAILGATVLGAGFGVYLSVDFALLTQVLPSARNRGKDLGVINIANSLPQVLAPAIAAPIVKHLGGYPVLYLLASAVTLLAGVLVTRIRSVS
ncbi:MFS transporter [Kribbella sp. VKM Ac-2566]|uniref:MFS transporter n=1 Tax=Kribbella sp. VKM Ac-2566 TaxID=2512218 RepID=UPI00106309E6|nr:MFS transporter [Kribbella sp. VKM Ac-2566]TDW98516.1 MFS transporter [Kribbella sp. VKM Ac-2566]